MIRVSCVLAAVLWACMPSVTRAETYTPGRKVDKDFADFAREAAITETWRNVA